MHLNIEARLTALIVATFGSLLFSSLTYALRDLPRVRLAEYLERNPNALLTGKSDNRR